MHMCANIYTISNVKLSIYTSFLSRNILKQTTIYTFFVVSHWWTGIDKRKLDLSQQFHNFINLFVWKALCQYGNLRKLTKIVGLLNMHLRCCICMSYNRNAYYSLFIAVHQHIYGRHFEPINRWLYIVYRWKVHLRVDELHIL